MVRSNIFATELNARFWQQQDLEFGGDAGPRLVLQDAFSQHGLEIGHRADQGGPGQIAARHMREIALDRRLPVRREPVIQPQVRCRGRRTTTAPASASTPSSRSAGAGRPYISISPPRSPASSMPITFSMRLSRARTTGRCGRSANSSMNSTSASLSPAPASLAGSGRSRTISRSISGCAERASMTTPRARSAPA